MESLRFAGNHYGKIRVSDWLKSPRARARVLLTKLARGLKKFCIPISGRFRKQQACKSPELGSRSTHHDSGADSTHVTDQFLLLLLRWGSSQSGDAFACICACSRESKVTVRLFPETIALLSLGLLHFGFVVLSKRAECFCFLYLPCECRNLALSDREIHLRLPELKNLKHKILNSLSIQSNGNIKSCRSPHAHPTN